MRVRQLARATDDGYRNGLVPGLKASADAERLADEIAFAATRLAQLATDPPGTYADAALETDREEGLWLAFLTAVVCPGEGEDPFAGVRAAHVPWSSGELPDLSAVPRGLRSSGDARTLTAYRAWAGRSGSQEAALAGEAAWTPQRRFDRVFERLSLPGFGRTARFELLTTLGAAGRYPLEAGSPHFVEDDPATLAAKRLFVSGDRMLLERRAKEFAQAADLPIAALDHGLAVWSTPGEHVDLTEDPSPGVASALRIG